MNRSQIVVTVLLIGSILGQQPVLGAPPPPPPPVTGEVASDSSANSPLLDMPEDVPREPQNRVVTVFVQVLLGGFIGVGAAFMGAFVPALSCVSDSRDSSDCNTRVDIALRAGWVVGSVPTVWVFGDVMGWDGSFWGTLLGGFLGAFIPPYGELEYAPALAIASLAGSVIGFHLTADPKSVAVPTTAFVTPDNPNLDIAGTTLVPVIYLNF